MTPSPQPHLTEQYFTPMLNCNCEVCKDAREQHDATIRKEEWARILKWLGDKWQFFEIVDDDNSERAQIEGYDMLVESLRNGEK